MSRIRKLSMFATFVAISLVLSACSTPKPEGVVDAQADELARQMMRSVNAEAWKETGAVTWTFADRNSHLWDRDRQLARVRTGDLEVFVDLNTRAGVAFEEGQRLTGEDAAEAVEEAYTAWANDSFWLTAMLKPFDPGTKRSRVEQEDGSVALLVEYSSGGVTPGDAYLWHFDADGRPTSWDMWVSIVPIGGASATWEGWEKLPTGAYVSTLHEMGPLTVEVTDLDAARTLDDLVEGDDPFEVLVGE